MVWTLADCWQRHTNSPETFEIPNDVDIASLKPGDFAKLIFQAVGAGERMWVKVEERTGQNFSGWLANTPATIDGLNVGDRIEFHARHIAQVRRVE
jgi:uncharacterized protein YegJ (DUF2314 family)